MFENIASYVCGCVSFHECVAAFMLTCGMCACERACVCACACVCVSVYVRAHVCACGVYVHSRLAHAHLSTLSYWCDRPANIVVRF